MTDVSLKVNGKSYGGWKAVRVTRSLESCAGSFDLEISDRWADQAQPVPVQEQDECTVSLGKDVVVTGYVDKRTLSYDAGSHSLRVSGRDKTGDLVDCSAQLDKWEFKNVAVLTLAKRVAEPFGISVSLQAGLVLGPNSETLSVDPGDSAFEVIERLCRIAALLPVSDGRGGLVLTRAGSSRCTTELVEGKNILSASSEFDVTGRHRTYLVLGQHKGKDESSGATVAHVKATAEDSTVKRSARTLLIRPEKSVTVAQAKVRAQWEANVRAARGDSVSVTVQGWTQKDGSLWPVNAYVRVRSPMIGVDGDMLVCQVTHGLDDGGSTTQLELRRPDAFKPEPVITKVKVNGYWKEIVRGV